jgi:predicted ATPase
MLLKLKNVGIIKEAEVEIDGLTVIAGENDTGKSTVGKALFSIIITKEMILTDEELLNSAEKELSDRLRLKKKKEKEKDAFYRYWGDDNEENSRQIIDEIREIDNETIEESSLPIANKSKKRALTSLIAKDPHKIEEEIKVIETRIEELKKIVDLLQEKDSSLLNRIENENREEFVTKFKRITGIGLENESICLLEDYNNNLGMEQNKYLKQNIANLKGSNVVLIETPILVNLYTFFSKLDTLQSEIEYDVSDYPFVLRSLYKQLKLPLKQAQINSELYNEITEVINGEVKINSLGNIVFSRDNKEFDILATATGIKSFGILQLLNKNGYLVDKSIVIFDEPEVHLHPKWQLEMAKLIVNLVKSGVRAVVNSHSPYMIEALKRFSEKEKIEEQTNFYLAEDGYIKQIENDNSKTLEKIFNKLSEPFETFEQMDSEDLESFING